MRNRLFCTFFTLGFCFNSFAEDQANTKAAALEVISAQGEKCNDDAVKERLAGIEPDDEIAFQLFTHGCLDAHKAWIGDKKFTPSQLSAITVKVFNLMSKEKLPALRKMLAEKRITLTQSDAYLAGLLPAVGETYAKSACQKGEKATCDYVKKFSVMEKESSTLIGKIAKLDSDQSALIPSDEVCSSLETIKYHQGVVAKQREIASISGVADSNALYQSGNTIVGLKKQLAPYAKSYKKRNGRDLDLKYCPEKYQN